MTTIDAIRALENERASLAERLDRINQVLDDIGLLAENAVEPSKGNGAAKQAPKTQKGKADMKVKVKRSRRRSPEEMELARQRIAAMKTNTQVTDSEIFKILVDEGVLRDRENDRALVSKTPPASQ